LSLQGRLSPSLQNVPQCWNWQTGAVCNRVPNSTGIRVRSPAGDQFLIRLPDAVLYHYMTKKTKTKRKTSKPGPQEERLIIRGSPQRAIDMLLKKKPK
jgi:hypothetical protein